MSGRGANLRLAAVAALWAGAGCAPPAPESPTWSEDVRPITTASCIQCHTPPSIGGAPRNFRLDVFGTTVTDEGDTIYGAGTMAQFMYLRTTAASMPPRFPITHRQRKTIERWFDPDGAEDRLGAPPPKGGARTGNRAPSMTLTTPLERSRVGDRLVIEYQIDDADLDVVTGELLAGPTRQAVSRVTGELHYGRGQAVWDIGAAQEGDYQLFAVLDDGSGTTEVELGGYSVVHPGGNTAPRIAITAPTQDQILADVDSPFDVVVSIEDPDPLDPLTLTVEASRPNEVVVLADEIAAQTGDNLVSFDTTGAGESANWRIDATVSDGKSDRSAQTLPFIIGHRSTTRTYEDVRDIFLTYCTRCHPGAAIPDVPHDFGVYRGVEEIPGVHELAGTIYRRVFQQGNMPPTSAQLLFPDDPIMSADERQALAEWLLAGAPE